MRLLLLLLLTLSLGFSETLYVAAASSMRPFVEELKKALKKEEPSLDIKVSYGSSGSLYRQILGGAPHDLFLSANELYPEKLFKRGISSEPVVFALGRLAVFSLKFKMDSPEILLKARRVAIANPRHAPYGRAALEYLKAEGLYESVREKLVYGSNVGQAFQFVVSGGAEVGIVSLSLVLHYGKGNYILIPPSKHPPIKHTASITERGRGKKLSIKFINFLLSPEARRLLKSSGFEVP